MDSYSSNAAYMGKIKNTKLFQKFMQKETKTTTTNASGNNNKAVTPANKSAPVSATGNAF